MKFLADENISRKVVLAFRNAGYDVETVQTLNIRSITNSALLQETIKLNRILITFDSDFETPKQIEFPEILLIRITPNIDPKVLPIIQWFLEEINKVSFENNIIILEEKSYKVL
jgi:predicted nuclease of predicted toxin-antitoxin system